MNKKKFNDDDDDVIIIITCINKLDISRNKNDRILKGVFVINIEEFI